VTHLVCLFAAFTLLSLPSLVAADTGFLDRSVTVSNETYRYQVYVPLDWNPQQRWPVILFLHGAGERGSDGALQTNIGLGPAIRADRTRFPAIVVFPQSRREQGWTLAPMQEQALAALEAVSKEFNGDADRTYLAGLSNGGSGALRIASRYPSRFAALIVICGRIEPTSPTIPERQQVADVDLHPFLQQPDAFAALAQVIRGIPIQIFHGDSDQTVPVEQSRRLFTGLQSVGAPVHYTEYPGVGHNSWDKTFAEPSLMPWLLAQRRKAGTN
jgi:predicted peptidase